MLRAVIIIWAKLKRSIFLGKRGGEDSWRSFETDPHLKVTRTRIFSRCLPCLSDLLQQLKRDDSLIDIGNAFSCWKISVILPDYEYCLEFLHRFSSLWPSEYVCGKLGTSDPKKRTRVVVFHLDEEKDRLDGLKAKIEKCAETMDVPYEIKISRGCSFPHEALFGPCENWDKIMAVANWEMVSPVVKRLERMLYGPKP